MLNSEESIKTYGMYINGHTFKSLENKISGDKIFHYVLFQIISLILSGLGIFVYQKENKEFEWLSNL